MRYEQQKYFKKLETEKQNAQIKLKGHPNRKRAFAPRGCKTKTINQQLGKRKFTLPPISEKSEKIRNGVINTLQEQVNVVRSVGKSLDDLGNHQTSNKRHKLGKPNKSVTAENDGIPPQSDDYKNKSVKIETDEIPRPSGNHRR